MLDSCNSAYIPYVFEEKPELFSAFSGFTYYPNCVAFGNHTRIGASPLWGGYEYTPDKIQSHRNETMQKHNEALLVLPKLFLDNDYAVVVTDPPIANYSWKPDLSIFKNYPQIKAENIVSKYTHWYLQEHPELKIVSISDVLRTRLIRYAFFTMAPAAFRIFIYDRADWLIAPSGTETNLSFDTIDNYTALAALPDITSITTEDKNTYIAMGNDITHNPAFFQLPDYTPSINIDISNLGSGEFSTERTYHATVAAFLLLAKWFNFLKENDVYDNTRIVIASDHGRGFYEQFEKNILLPNGDFLSDYNATLLVKDFDETAKLVTDDTFMTHADVPIFAVSDLITNAANPFTKVILSNREKQAGATVTSARALQYIIRDDQWMHVTDNIFDVNNWEIILR
jgi:hypothetical protein